MVAFGIIELSFTPCQSSKNCLAAVSYSRQRCEIPYLLLTY